MATEKKVKESANVIMLSGDREYKVPVENRIVTVRAKFGKGQGKLRLTPAVSANSNQLLSGQPILTESDKLIVPKVVTAESYMDLEDGKKINLNNAYEAIDYAWAILTKELGESQEQMREDENCLFYIEDVEKALDKKLDSKQRVFQAQSYIYDSTISKQRELVKLIGVKSADFWTERQILDYLLSFTEKSVRGNLGADTILSLKTDKSYDLRVFLLTLEEKKIISWNKGVLKFNDTSLGLTNEQAIEWLKDPANESIVEAMKIAANMSKS